MTIFIQRSFCILLFILFLTASCSKAPSGMVHVPEGSFTMGSAEEDTEGLGYEFGVRGGELYLNERPVRELH